MICICAGLGRSGGQGRQCVPGAAAVQVRCARGPLQREGLAGARPAPLAALSSPVPSSSSSRRCPGCVGTHILCGLRILLGLSFLLSQRQLNASLPRPLWALVPCSWLPEALCMHCACCPLHSSFCPWHSPVKLVKTVAPHLAARSPGLSWRRPRARSCARPSCAATACSSGTRCGGGNLLLLPPHAALFRFFFLTAVRDCELWNQLLCEARSVAEFWGAHAPPGGAARQLWRHARRGHAGLIRGAAPARCV